ncbi:conserved oligomeric Golgi complex subunit 6-like [Oppia nitens]|uniref:conserved oligomeric Golgi complex subunit 6-like n=1 Tax=Oppia nitens TaxID=1686743 RepID=UPI0023DCB54F|nr:conserved oligomeric Golgi complex subunit 6-like [Oppia nitens]
MATNTELSHVLTNKVNKIVNTDIDEDTLLAMKSVSHLFKDNTLHNRRNLRTNIEKQSLKINEEFVNCFGSVRDQLNDLFRDVQRMNDNCHQMIQQIETTKSQTSHLLKQTDQLRDEVKQIEIKEVVAKRFIETFQLTPEELMIISNSNEDIDDKFFDIIAKVRQIHEKAKHLLTNSQQMTGIEIMDSMALHEEGANERLYRWTLNILRTISSDVIEVHPQLFRAMACLQEREILFKYCLDEYVTVRRSAIVRNFIEALTRGRPNSNLPAIESHSHDIVRYVSDMFAYLHQTIANEKEMIDTLLKLCKNEMMSTTTSVTNSIASITEGLCRPLKVRVEQSLISDPKGMVKMGPSVYYRIKNMIGFYLHTLTQNHLLTPDSPFIYALKEMLTLSDKIFYNSLNYCLSRIGRTSTNEVEVPASDLKPTESVTQMVTVIDDVLHCQSSCLSSDSERQKEVEDILSTVIEPLTHSCIISASKLTPIEMAVFLFNCLSAINQTISGYRFTDRFQDKLRLQTDGHIETLINEQISHVISYLGLGSLHNAIQLKDEITLPLSQVSGCDSLAIKSAMLKFDTFIARPLELSLTQTSHMIDLNAKDLVWKRSLEAICLIYQQMYESVNNSNNCYVDPNQLMTYSAQQIKMLLL